MASGKRAGELEKRRRDLLNQLTRSFFKLGDRTIEGNAADHIKPQIEKTIDDLITARIELAIIATTPRYMIDADPVQLEAIKKAMAENSDYFIAPAEPDDNTCLKYTVPDPKGMAEAIADVLFVSGQGEVADRLVMTIDIDHVNNTPTRHLGGWCKQAVVDRVTEIIKFQSGIL